MQYHAVKLMLKKADIDKRGSISFDDFLIQQVKRLDESKVDENTIWRKWWLGWYDPDATDDPIIGATGTAADRLSDEEVRRFRFPCAVGVAPHSRTALRTHRLKSTRKSSRTSMRTCPARSTQRSCRTPSCA